MNKWKLFILSVMGVSNISISAQTTISTMNPSILHTQVNEERDSFILFQKNKKTHLTSVTPVTTTYNEQPYNHL